MRLFRRARDTKTSVIRREAVPVSLAPVSLAPDARASAAAEAMDTRGEPPVTTVESYDAIDDSDVFVCEAALRDSRPRRTPQPIREVTLFVHAWHNVEPGLLSWTFPSLRAALDAVQRMKNAVGWCVVSGTEWSDLDTARAEGAILVEQLSA